MIRPTIPADTSALLAIATASGLFEPSQTAELAQMLSAHFDRASNSPDYWLTDDDNGPVGVAYVAPERMTTGTWNLYLIAIHPDHQRQGRGALLLAQVEKMLTQSGERLLLVETAGTEDFEYVRSFYRQSGYQEEAKIRDFYTAGVDKIVYSKKLQHIQIT
jgi:ribosomal protein S18 acetylase RimI-like enzyme